MEEHWEDAKPFQQIARWECGPCGGETTDHRVIIDRHTREPKQWRCDRCYTLTKLILPFPATEPPVGMEQIYLALATMAIYTPIVRTFHQQRLYAVTRRFFNAGWSVRDILYAIDYKPDDSVHDSAAINTRDHGDVILGRIQTRLRSWIWRDRFEDDEGGDVMPGPHTSMRKAMAARAEEQQVRALSREIEWAEQRQLAQEARQKGAHILARMQVTMAVERAKERKREGDLREAEALAELIAWARGQSSKPAKEEIVFSRSSKWKG